MGRCLTAPRYAFELMLTYHHRCQVTFIWRQFYTKMSLKKHRLNFNSNLPGAIELTSYKNINIFTRSPTQMQLIMGCSAVKSFWPHNHINFGVNLMSHVALLAITTTDISVTYHFIQITAIHLHDHVIKWKHFQRYWPFLRGIHRSPVNSPHKGQCRGALMFSLDCAWTNDWVNNVI